MKASLFCTAGALLTAVAASITTVFVTPTASTETVTKTITATTTASATYCVSQEPRFFQLLGANDKFMNLTVQTPYLWELTEEDRQGVSLFLSQTGDLVLDEYGLYHPAQVALTGNDPVNFSDLDPPTANRLHCQVVRPNGPEGPLTCNVNGKLDQSIFQICNGALNIGTSIGTDCTQISLYALPRGH